MKAPAAQRPADAATTPGLRLVRHRVSGFEGQAIARIENMATGRITIAVGHQSGHTREFDAAEIEVISVDAPPRRRRA